MQRLGQPQLFQLIDRLHNDLNRGKAQFFWLTIGALIWQSKIQKITKRPSIHLREQSVEIKSTSYC